MTQEHPHETRERIFDAAARLFAERGHAAVSMREVAEEAGVSKPMLYYYFESKKGLCRALVEFGADRMVESTRRIVSQPTPVVERLRDLVRYRFRLVAERPELMRFYMRFFHAPEANELEAAFFSRLGHAMQAVADLLAEGQENGELRRDVDPVVAAGVFAGSTNHHVGMHIHCGAPELTEELADEVVRLFITGMAPRNKPADEAV